MYIETSLYWTLFGLLQNVHYMKVFIVEGFTVNQHSNKSVHKRHKVL